MSATEIPIERLEELAIEPMPSITIDGQVKLQFNRYDPRFADDGSPPIYHVDIFLCYRNETGPFYPLFTSPVEATARAAYDTAAAQLQEGYAVRIINETTAELVKPDK